MSNELRLSLAFLAAALCLSVALNVLDEHGITPVDYKLQRLFSR